METADTVQWDTAQNALAPTGPSAAGGSLVFDPLAPGTVPTWTDAEVLAIVERLGAALLGEDWRDVLGDTEHVLYATLDEWDRAVTLSRSQPDLAVARVRLQAATSAPRPARRQMKEVAHG